MGSKNDSQNLPARHPPRWITQCPDLIIALHRVCHVSLKCGSDAVDTSSVMAAAHQRNVFRVRPTKRHCRAGWGPEFHMGLWQVRFVPQLFGEHAALVGKILDGRNERLWITSGRQFVMATFSRQDRPATSNASSIKRTTVVLLSITIVIVATPARTLWQIVFDHAIDDFD